MRSCLSGKNLLGLNQLLNVRAVGVITKLVQSALHHHFLCPLYLSQCCSSQSLGLRAAKLASSPLRHTVADSARRRWRAGGSPAVSDCSTGVLALLLVSDNGKHQAVREFPANTRIAAH